MRWGRRNLVRQRTQAVDELGRVRFSSPDQVNASISQVGAPFQSRIGSREPDTSAMQCA